jgi:hypothetical protein
MWRDIAVVRHRATDAAPVRDAPGAARPLQVSRWAVIVAPGQR